MRDGRQALASIDSKQRTLITEARSPAMTTSDSGHASEGIVKDMGNKEVQPKSRNTSIFRWTLGLVVRLCIWYILLTPFFRCPAQLSDLNESSPRVCKPYLVARSYVEPHVLPFYNTYGAPYVEKARPYVGVLNEKVYTPAANVAKLGYDKYGAPALEQAHAYGSEQWEKQVAPLLQSAKDGASELYNAEVAPQVQRVTAVMSPYYQKANFAFKTTCVGYIQPFLSRTRPFIGKTYTSGQNVLTTTVMPYAQTSWSSVVYFVNSWLWPQVTGLYSENVEPQLVKIGQRLASYREGNQLRKVVDEVDNSSEQLVSVVPASSETSKIESTPTTSTTVVSSTSRALSPTELATQTREKIESDLRTWQEKFSVAADLGIEDLEERLYGLVGGYVNGGAENHGRSLLTALETAVEHELSAVKLRIGELTEALPSEHSPAEQTTQSELLKDIRQAAVVIRDRAHAIREWHSSFDQEALSDDILSRGMDVAEAAAKELARLKDVGRWKIAAREVSDNFDTRSGSPPPRPMPSEPSTPAPQEHYLDADSPNHKASMHRETGNASSAAQGAAESEDQALGLDDAPIAHDHVNSEGVELSNEELEPSEAPAESGAQQTDREEDTTKSTWGVAAAEAMSKQGVPECEEVPENVYSALNSVRKNYAEVERSAGAGSSQSLEQEAHEQPDDSQNLHKPQAPSSSSAHYEAVENLVSELLAGKDPSFVQDVMDKLHAIYRTSHPASEPQKDIVANDRAASIPFSPATSMRVGGDSVKDSYEQPEAFTPVVESATSSAVYTPSEPAFPLESTQEQHAMIATNEGDLILDATETATYRIQNSDDNLEETPDRDGL
ncbi:transcription factor hoxa13 [Aspergillus oryzae 100-8]|nr:transcription factor hoxa13 [Aspergillus oryzae 100-8]